jgi:8-oxo-dGTP pyrophosphatase MutT (NUDIX family)
MDRELIEREMAELADRFGTPIRHTARLDIDGLFSPLGKDDRWGEVCMVLQRRNGLLLTARKSFYPPDGFRLLTGGIAHDEPVLDALHREVAEETGLDVAIRRFLAAISYETRRKRGAAPRFWTFAFLLDEIGGTLHCADPDERVEEYREVTVGELPQLAFRLDHLRADYDREIGGSWSDWGRFRAVVHRIVFAALTE